MAIYDVFNGDADGICALIQLRLNDPKESTLITGIKRDIALLQQVDVDTATDVTVLDVSMEKNIKALNSLLAKGCQVFYVDHHRSGDIPADENLNAIINLAPDVCTSLLVNGHLKNKYAHWAVVGAYGDNLKNSANLLADQIGMTEDEKVLAERFGILINYNGYGAHVDDLHFHPKDLYERLVKHKTPLDLISHEPEVFKRLDDGYNGDMQRVSELAPKKATDIAAVYMLPNAPWARRVSGVFGNDLANQYPDRAHAILTEKPEGGYLVSIRAPLNNKTGADEIASQFATGGGRAAAAGINHLDGPESERFINLFLAFYEAH